MWGFPIVKAWPRWRIITAAVLASAVILCAAAVAWFSAHYLYKIEQVKNGSFQSLSEVFAAPREIRVGDALTSADVILVLQRNGYRDTPNKDRGQYTLDGAILKVAPGPGSYFIPEPVQISFSRTGISQIRSLVSKTSYPNVRLEPELISNLPDKNRVKKRTVRFADIPPVLVQAVVAVEDKHFFQHGGFDIFRIVKAAYVDLRERRMEQGASTLSMQLARSLFLGQEKTFGRKLREALVTILTQVRFSKLEIFEYYANNIYLGQSGTFSVHGFAEASRTYFGKDIRQLQLPEAALLAGLIQRPSYLNPFRWPDRALARRKTVLAAMVGNRAIAQQQYETALKAPLQLASRTMESTDAPYFLDMVNESVAAQLSDPDFLARSHRIYTSLDLDLQRDAVAAANWGMEQVDAQLRKGRKPVDVKPQVALIALDTATGALKALVGGRDYAASQLNHAVANRQPGSAFKPFVYAAGLSMALHSRDTYITPATLLVDEPTTFTYRNQTYRPGNFRDRFHGVVTVREALSESMNIPAVKVAEMAGYDNVAKLARSAGLDAPLPATPSIALGAYDVSPLELAGAYTVFARQGKAIQPHWIAQIRNRDGSAVSLPKPLEQRTLDPRVAYMMINLMEDVLRSGTGAGARAGGFGLPAAGKTGTSRDGWFAGFTSKLLCVVWVGFDDGRDLKLEGSKSALPIWREFMKRAHRHPQFKNAGAFPVPPGIDRVVIDSTSNELATPVCPEVRSEIFLSGSQPKELCHLHPEPKKGVKGFFRKIWGVFK